MEWPISSPGATDLAGGVEDDLREGRRRQQPDAYDFSIRTVPGIGEQMYGAS